MNANEKYLKILDIAKKIRSERRKIYGDTWIYDVKPKEFIIFIKAKIARLERQLTNKKKSKKQYENAIDCVCDAINYLAFVGAQQLKNGI